MVPECLCPASVQRGHFPDAELSPEPAASSPALLQTLQKKASVVSVAEITFDRSVYAQLPGQEAKLRAQVETVCQAAARLASGFRCQIRVPGGGSQGWREGEDPWWDSCP